MPPLPSWANIKIEHNKNQNLDGAVLVSPGAERITTRLPDTGGPVGPGVTAQRALLVQNRSKGTITFDLAIAQVVGSPNPDDQVQIRDGIHEGAAAWVTLDGSTATLKPGDMATVQLYIKIPKSVKPGSKSFAVTVTQRTSSGAAAGAQVTPIYRQVAIFIVDLPGNAPVKGHITTTTLYARGSSNTAAGSTQGSSHLYLGSHKFAATVSYINKGERLLTPQGHIEITDLFGRVVEHYSVPRFTAYPDGAAATTIALKNLPSLGVLHAKLVLESDAGQQTRSLGTIVVAPWWAVAVLAILLLMLIAAVVRYALDRRRWKRETAEADGLDHADDDEAIDDPYANEIDDDDQ